MTIQPEDCAAVLPDPAALPARAIPPGASAGLPPEVPPTASGGTLTPAGSAVDADAALPAGSSPGEAAVKAKDPGTRPGRAPYERARPGQDKTAARTWTLELPAGMPLLSLNGREHWSARHVQAQAFKQAAWVLARQAKIPALGRISVAAEYQPPDRRRRDADNPMPTVKACLDGIVAAGVLEDDASPEFVTQITCTIGSQFPRGRIVLHLTEVPA